MLVDRGVALDAVGRHAEAQTSYRAVLATSPRHVSARNDLALSLAVTGQYDEAVALLTPLARSSAATPRIRENLALVYGLMGDADRAATLSRADLDDSSIQINQAFFAAVRGGDRQSLATSSDQQPSPEPAPSESVDATGPVPSASPSHHRKVHHRRPLPVTKRISSPPQGRKHSSKDNRTKCGGADAHPSWRAQARHPRLHRYEQGKS